jgi:hypothetical protein
MPAGLRWKRDHTQDVEMLDADDVAEELRRRFG